MFKISHLALAVSALAISSSAFAQSAALQDSSISGFHQTIDIGWLPVTNSQGVTTYKDVIITLSVDAKGDITYATAKPSVSNSPKVSPVKIQAGVYTEVGGGKPPIEIQIKGPQALTSGGGVDVWTIVAGESGSIIGAPANAILYTGPVASYPASSGILSCLQQGSINTRPYLGFGTVQASSQHGGWDSGTVFGVYVADGQVVFDPFFGCVYQPGDSLSYTHN